MTERPEIGTIYEYGRRRVKILQNDVRHMSRGSCVYVTFEDLDNGYLYGMDLHEFNSKYAERKKQKVVNNYAKESEKPFALSDLENGMVVETRNGLNWIVIGDMICAGKHDSGYSEWIPLEHYDDNLSISPYDRQFDIIKIYAKRQGGSYLFHYFRGVYGEVIWRRADIVELTKAEIAERLGVDFENLRIKE